MTNRDYRFDVQLEAGIAVEEWYQELVGNGSHITVNGRHEVKHDQRALDTGNVYVEMKCDKGCTGVYEPSGLATTEAECWVFVFGEPPQCFIGVPTSRLRELALTGWVASQPHGSCPTKGVVLSVATLIAG